MNETLIVYFSASGKTETKAQELAQVLGGDMYEIEPTQVYTNDDLDWTNTKSRSSIEMNNKDLRPEMKKKDLNIDQYEEIYIGFPIWWYTAPTIINTFIESIDLSGKKICLFGTSGGSGIAKALKDLSRAYPQYHFEKAVLLNGQVSKEIL